MRVAEKTSFLYVAIVIRPTIIILKRLRSVGFTICNLAKCFLCFRNYHLIHIIQSSSQFKQIAILTFCVLLATKKLFEHKCKQRHVFAKQICFFFCICFALAFCMCCLVGMLFFLNAQSYLCVDFLCNNNNL